MTQHGHREEECCIPRSQGRIVSQRDQHRWDHSEEVGRQLEEKIEGDDRFAFEAELASFADVN